MGLLSFLKRKSKNASAPAAAPESADTVQQARIRARQRLVGAVVLVVAGVVGFPLLFETQPRPLPADTPIEIARKEAAEPAVRPAAQAPVERAAALETEPARDEAPATRVAPPAPVTAEPPARTSPPPAVERSEPRPAAPAPKPPEHKPAAPSRTDSARAQALLEGKPPAAPASDVRFIVQVGAYADASAARDVRQKVEKLGLKTYTQVVETSAGNRVRVRVGPFASRDDAERAAGKIKSAGLNSAVFTL